MNLERQNQYLILPETGQRKDTKLAAEYSEEQIAELLKQGYVVINQTDFNKLIGNADGEYLIADDGSVYLKPAPTDAELLAAAKPAKIAELKAERDAEEVKPVEYKGNLYDYDDKSRDRINAAIIALDAHGEGANIAWTLADNSSVNVTANDFRMVIANVAIRSNDLHVKYRTLKEKILACKTAAELEKIVW